jgi:ribosomal protein L29
MAKETTTKKTTKVAKATEVKTLAELQADLVALHSAQLESLRSHKQGELVNPHVLTVQRKDIARLHTAIAVAVKAEKLSTLKEEK